MKGLWFVLFIIAMQVISGIIQHRKKQQERKAREEAMRQRALAQGGMVHDRPPQAAPVIVAPPTTPSASVELESRRKAQLEQLRQRRESRRGSIADVQTRIPIAQSRRGMPVPTQLPKRGPSSADQSIIASEQSRIRAQEATRRVREAERQRKEQQGRTAAAAQEVRDLAAHEAYEKVFHSVAGESEAAAHGIRVQATAASVTLDRKRTIDRAGAAGASILERLGQPAALREMIVLREIIDRPLSLRNDGR